MEVTAKIFFDMDDRNSETPKMFHKPLLSQRLIADSKLPFLIAWGGVHKHVLDVTEKVDKTLREKPTITLDEVQRILDMVSEETLLNTNASRFFKKRGITKESITETKNWFNTNFK